MTFEEALEFKKNTGETIIKGDHTLVVWVTPSNNIDLKNYLAFYAHNNRHDDVAKEFSSDGKYEVHGIKFVIGSSFILIKIS